MVRHAEGLAVRLGEPLGTLVLTLAVTGIEVMMIAAVTSAGPGNPALARDSMFAVVMIVLNGMVGLVRSLAKGWSWLKSLYQGPVKKMDHVPRRRLLMVPPPVAPGKPAPVMQFQTT